MRKVWFEGLRPICEEVCADARKQPTDVVLFYLARWCQKKARTPEPRVRAFEQAKLRDVAERIARHLAESGTLVDRLVARDAEAWTELRRELLESARPRAGAEGEDFAEEALVRIAKVLVTGTPPSRAAEELARGPDGPRNEYIFASPFSNWARAVVINLIKDHWRAGQLAPGEEKRSPRLDKGLVERARAALPGLLQAIRELPRKQRAVMILSLNRRRLDAAVRERLHELAPDLFSDAGPLVSSDKEIAERLGSTPRQVVANRSAARRKLVRRDPDWPLLLDILLPHRSTRPVDTGSED